MAQFAIFEENGDTFQRVDVLDTNEEAQQVSTRRVIDRLEAGEEKVEQRVVPFPDGVEMPVQAQLDDLMEIVRENRDLFHMR